MKYEVTTDKNKFTVSKDREGRYRVDLNDVSFTMKWGEPVTFYKKNKITIKHDRGNLQSL